MLLFVSVVLILFQYKPVQTWAARKATKYLSDELHTKVDIKSLYIKPFSSVVLQDLYVLDKQKDTLLRTPLLEVELKGFSIFNSIKRRELNFDRIQLDNGTFHLKQYKDSTTNLAFIIDYFNGPKDTTKVSKPWKLDFGLITIKNFHFIYKNDLVRTATPGVVNFDDLDVTNFSVQVTGMNLKDHLFKGNVKQLSLHEKRSGFIVKELTANTTVDTNQIVVQNMRLVTPNSHLKDYFRMRFKSFGDFSDFENKVTMDARIKSSHLSSADIGYFTSSLENINFELGIDGRATGMVNNIKARGLTVTAAQGTYLRGDFDLKGLPDWDNTYLSLDFDQLASNKKDLDYLYSHFTGTPGQRMPDFFAKLGNINFKGQLNGTQNNFKVKGAFKTALGRVDPDLRLSFDARGVPAYKGTVATTNFDLATLLDDRTLGRTTLKAKVDGRGDELKNLNVGVDARIAYIDYNGYQYQNINGVVGFKQQIAKGKISISDRNFKLKLNGSVNLNPKLPQYNFTASLRDAKLNKLKLMKDTITLSTDLSTNFHGNDLNNLQGFITLSPTRISTPRENFVIDSISVKASGTGKDRVIDLASDMANGHLKGTIDLASLPSYYKGVAKKYIPSLNAQIASPGKQDFDLRIDLKNLDPILLLFAPAVKIPDGGTIVSRFNTATHTASVSGLIRTIKYNKMVLHDLILDENTTDSLLTANVSLSKIDITDSLFIKDINITNFLRNDSLNFNVKLSDKNAANQLDLYGLVAFGRDTTAKLTLLPSDVVLERQPWRLTDQVRIRLLDGKTRIEGFELSNGIQEVHIDGLISDSPEDILKVSFKSFSMATLNQLTKAAGVTLGGHLNGDVKLSSVLKVPGAEADLRIDSLSMNKTRVGDVKLVSNLDVERNRAEVKLNILNRALETMNIAGVYNLGDKDNEASLDFDVRMDQTEAVIFEPFVSSLVSNLKGTISSDLRLTGPPSNPKLNGTLTLANTGVTVDYLKVPYTINDKLSVTNSVIKIDNMQISDGRSGKGVANGKIDLSDFANPLLDIKVRATNLMALNTTFKDNRLYYGTAFGSGDFSFSGPVDDMKIDIKAKTQEGTIFNIPLNTSYTASDYDFIRFVSHKDSTKVISNSNAFKGVTLNFDLSADEKTVVRITTDLGLLEGRGTANGLKLAINSLGDFDMKGDFLISSGKFEFTAKDFISKNFQVNQGGTIRWTGNPANAEINLKATYELRANISDLYAAAGFQSAQPRQELVQAQLNLTHTLTQPVISFDFNFPLNPSIKDELTTYLSDVNNRNQQALSLIVRRQFAPGTGSNINRQVMATASTAVSEFFFNKLNSYIAQSTNFKSLDLNIRSPSDASVAVRLFKDRVVLNGSIYNPNGTNDLFRSNSSNLFNTDSGSYTKDFNAEYLIRQDGQLRLRYSYRTLNSTTLTTFGNYRPQYVNGLGVVYQRDFDSFREFFRNLFTSPNRSNSRTRNGQSSQPGITTDGDPFDDDDK